MKIVLFYLLQVALVIDQAFNVLLGGYADETLSSRAYRADRDNKIFGNFFRPIIDFIFILFGDKNHCFKSYSSERNNSHLPPEFRD